MIALGRYAVDYKLVKAVEPVTVVNIECPCGLVRTEVNVTNGRTGRVSFSSVVFIWSGLPPEAGKRTNFHLRHCLWRRVLRASRCQPV